MARPRTVEPQEIVDAVRNGMFGSEAARKFGVSRVRVNQILAEHAPELLKGKLKSRSKDEIKEVKARQRAMIAATKKALKDHPTHVAAAEALGITTSGLYSRMRRHGLDVVKPRKVAA